jgi:hypothetical protein
MTPDEVSSVSVAAQAGVAAHRLAQQGSLPVQLEIAGGGVFLDLVDALGAPRARVTP